MIGSKFVEINNWKIFTNNLQMILLRMKSVTQIKNLNFQYFSNLKSNLCQEEQHHKLKMKMVILNCKILKRTFNFKRQQEIFKILKTHFLIKLKLIQVMICLHHHRKMFIKRKCSILHSEYSKVEFLKIIFRNWKKRN